MCGQNDDPSMIELMESLERGTKQLADDMMRDINQEMILYPPTPKTEEEMEARFINPYICDRTSDSPPHIVQGKWCVHA